MKKANFFMEEYRLWIAKAEDDLNWAKQSIKSRIFYGACFAAQQAAEKALKAFLIKHNKPLVKIHDLNALLENCIKIDREFDTVRHSVEVLFPYYVETRYPFSGDLVAFGSSDADEALLEASEIIEFVKKKL